VIAKKTLMLVKSVATPASSSESKKRSLRSNTVLETSPAKKEIKEKKRDKKAKTKKLKPTSSAADDTDSKSSSGGGSGPPPTKGKDFSFLLKSKHKKKKGSKGKTLAPKRGLEAVAEEASNLEREGHEEEEGQSQ
jgi:hypothetical protein